MKDEAWQAYCNLLIRIARSLSSLHEPGYCWGFYNQAFWKAEMVMIIGVMKPHMDDVTIFI